MQCRVVIRSGVGDKLAVERSSEKDLPLTLSAITPSRAESGSICVESRRIAPRMRGMAEQDVFVARTIPASPLLAGARRERILRARER